MLTHLEPKVPNMSDGLAIETNLSPETGVKSVVASLLALAIMQMLSAADRSYDFDIILALLLGFASFWIVRQILKKIFVIRYRQAGALFYTFVFNSIFSQLTALAFLLVYVLPMLMFGKMLYEIPDLSAFIALPQMAKAFANFTILIALALLVSFTGSIRLGKTEQGEIDSFWTRLVLALASALVLSLPISAAIFV